MFTHALHVHTDTEEVERCWEICSRSSVDYLMRNVDYLMRNADYLMRMLDVHYLAFAHPSGKLLARNAASAPRHQGEAMRHVGIWCFWRQAPSTMGLNA